MGQPNIFGMGGPTKTAAVQGRKVNCWCEAWGFQRMIFHHSAECLNFIFFRMGIIFLGRKYDQVEKVNMMDEYEGNIPI